MNLKIRFADFTQVTRAHSMDTPIDVTRAIGAVAEALLGSVDIDQGVRLLGVSLTGLVPAGVGLQLSLDLGPPTSGLDADHADGAQLPPPSDRPLARAGEEAERMQGSWGTVTAAVDAIRARYGGSSVGPASLVGADGLRVRRRGEAQWGPTDTQAPTADDERPATL